MGSMATWSSGFLTPDDPGVDALPGLHNKELTDMASSGKRTTTMAKLTRESRLRERRLDKQAKKEARKRAAAHHPDGPVDTMNETTGESSRPAAEKPDLEAVVQALADA